MSADMARIRTIKPDAFSSDSLSAVPIPARWTFAGVWTYVDDEGRGRADPRLIKAHVYPLDDDVSAADVADHLDVLEKVDCIRRYEVDGKRYIHIPGWAAHQKISHPTRSKLPAPPETPSGHPPESSRALRRDSGDGPPNVAGATPNGVDAGQEHPPEPSGNSPEPSGGSPESSGPRARALEVEQGKGSGKGSGKGAGSARGRATAAAYPEPDPKQDRPLVLAGITDELIAEYAAALPHPLPRERRARLYTRVDSLLNQGITREQVREGLILLYQRPHLGPAVLPDLVHEAMAKAAATANGSASTGSQAPSRPPSAAARRKAGIAAARAKAAAKNGADPPEQAGIFPYGVDKNKVIDSEVVGEAG